MRDLALPLGLVQCLRIVDVDTRDLGLDLANRTVEPALGPKEPRAQTPEADDTDADGGVVERLRVDGVELRQAEDDGDESDPQHSDERHGAGEGAEVEGSADKAGWIDKANEDGETVGNVQADGGDRGRGREGNGRTDGGDGKEERQRGRKPDGPDRRMEAVVHMIEELGQRTVAAEGEHHAGVGGQGEEAAVPHADHDYRHKHDGAVFAEDVNKYLQYGLRVRARDGGVEILDREEQRDEIEKAEHGRHPDAHHHTEWRAPRRILRLFREMGRRIEACDGILSHQDPAASDVCGTRADAPTHSRGFTSAVVEFSENEFGGLVVGCLCQARHCNGEDAESVHDNGRVVEIAQGFNTEGVDHAVAEE